ncbi:hypothetical protein EV175_003518 [Coemansia sp. RSA 1933]|nr:hypothetical protein EV175_003518 [Coemansia sp. RSA 1933]
MSINLDQKITYQLSLGASLRKSNTTADNLANSGTEDSEFHLVSRNLPRTTTKLCRETLEVEPNIRARLLSVPAKSNSNGRGIQSAIFEANAHDQKTTCTYEGDYVNISYAADSSGVDDSEDVDCVLIYDAETKSFVIERLTANVSIKSSSQNDVNAPGPGSLALPANRSGPTGGVRREPTIDEAAEDELAKELEGMLDDVSDFGDSNEAQPTSANVIGDERLGRRDSARAQDKQLSMELAENLDDELFDEPVSDDDEFEEVDNVQFMEDDDTSPIERRNTKDSMADDDDMMFEEVEPFAELGSGSGGNLTGHGSGSAADDDFEFEDVGSPSVASLGANGGGGGGMDDTLFGGSFTSSPNTFQQLGLDGSASAQQNLPNQTSPESVVSGRTVSGHARASTGHDTETLDEFEDLDFDLTQSLQES